MFEEVGQWKLLWDKWPKCLSEKRNPDGTYLFIRKCQWRQAKASSDRWQISNMAEKRSLHKPREDEHNLNEKSTEQAKKSHCACDIHTNFS